MTPSWWMPDSCAEGVAPPDALFGCSRKTKRLEIRSDVFGAHDFVSLALFDDAVLVDAGLVREGVRAHDRLVRLHRKTSDTRDQARSRHDLGGVKPRVAREDIAARTHRHDHFLERGVAGALAEAVDGAFHLARAIEHRRKRVGDGEPQGVVAMHRKYRLVRLRHPLAKRLDEH